MGNVEDESDDENEDEDEDEDEFDEDAEDLSSENITFGSTNKGTQITVKGISKKKEDDLSIATDDDEFRLKSISRYSKQELVNIASERGLKFSERSNKSIIYDMIKKSL